MKHSYTVQPLTNCREWVQFDEPNAKGETILIELTKVTHDLEDKRSMMNRWKRAGFIAETLPTTWGVQTYVTDAQGNCWARYNPTHKLSDDGGRLVLDFSNLLGATEENRIKLIEAVEALAFNDELYTAESWARDHSFKAKPGQPISQEVYNEFFNVMPIGQPDRKELSGVRLRHSIDCAASFVSLEPYSHDERGALYMAFGRTENPQEPKETRFYYLGLLHKAH